MKSIEFCYWLQGMFELQNPTELNEQQTQTVKNHLAMVFHHDPQPSNFCAFMNGYLKIENPTSIGQSQTSAIKKQLNLIFEHVIEPKEIQKHGQIKSIDTRSKPRDILC